jgi:hypothetical protein
MQDILQPTPMPAAPVPLNSALSNRFYEPIILLVGLNAAWEDQQTSKAPDLVRRVHDTVYFKINSAFYFVNTYLL